MKRALQVLAAILVLAGLAFLWLLDQNSKSQQQPVVQQAPQQVVPQEQIRGANDMKNLKIP